METHPQPRLPDILKNTPFLPPPTPAQGAPFSNNPSSRSNHLHPTSQQSFRHWRSHNTHLGGPWGGGHRPPITSPWLALNNSFPVSTSLPPRSSGHLAPSSRSTQGLPPDSGTGVPAAPTSRQPGTVQPAPRHPRQPTCRLGLPLHHKPTPPPPRPHILLRCPALWLDLPKDKACLCLFRSCWRTEHEPGSHLLVDNLLHVPFRTRFLSLGFNHGAKMHLERP